MTFLSFEDRFKIYFPVFTRRKLLNILYSNLEMIIYANIGYLVWLILGRNLLSEYKNYVNELFRENWFGHLKYR